MNVGRRRVDVIATLGKPLECFRKILNDLHHVNNFLGEFPIDSNLQWPSSPLATTIMGKKMDTKESRSRCAHYEIAYRILFQLEVITTYPSEFLLSFLDLVSFASPCRFGIRFLYPFPCSHLSVQVGGLYVIHSQSI